MPDRLLESSAVRLFVERARAIHSNFEVTDEDASPLVRICRRLDGIPLAIELAAARVKLLSVEQIAARLDDRFHLLTHGDRTAPRRQQTLRAALDWSHDLLAEPEQTLLRRLSVFAGGWTLEAAEAVCGETQGRRQKAEGSPDAPPLPSAFCLLPSDILDLLSRLIDKSLVVAEEQGGEGRYRLLETIRQYGALRLQEAGEEGLLRRAHGEWFRALAEQSEVELRGGAQGIWLERLEHEHANLRAALTASLDDGQTETALRLAAALACFWRMRGYRAEGLERLGAVLAATAGARSSERARALWGAGTLAFEQGDYVEASAHCEESLALSRELGDRSGIAASLESLGLVALERGDVVGARAHLEESLAIKRELNDAWGIGVTQDNLGLVAQEEGDLATARQLHEASLAIGRTLGDGWGMARSLDYLALAVTAQKEYARARTFHEQSLALREELGDKGGVASSLDNMGYLSRCQGDCARAAALYAESLALAHELGDRDAIAESLEAFAVVAAMEQQHERAARLFGAAEILLEALHASLPHVERDDYDRAVAGVRAALGDAAFDAARGEGRAMSLEEAIALALASQDPR